MLTNAANLIPATAAYHVCPRCEVPLSVIGWRIPGMRSLADLECPDCATHYIGDLPAGHGLYFPSLLELPSGHVHAQHGADWFADWLGRGYRAQTARPLPLAIEGRAEGPRALVLNCLDMLYGHALLKLLNAQPYIDGLFGQPQLPVIVLIQRPLRWLVPDGIAEIWTVDLPLQSGIEWNNWLDEQMHARLAAFDQVWLAPAYAHPHPDRFNIERFTRIAPFPLDEWHERAKTAFRVTFIWREDRLWQSPEPVLPRPLRGLRVRIRRRVDPRGLVHAQRRRVIALAEHLRKRLARLDFAVAGIGDTGRFPPWMQDLRSTTVDVRRERDWCLRYANSHVVVGIHGSNMLLPSAHAGATVDLMPVDRWSNVLQDVLPRAADPREALFAARLIPASTGAAELAEITSSLLNDYGTFLISMRSEFSDPRRPLDPEAFLRSRRERLPHLPNSGEVDHASSA